MGTGINDMYGFHASHDSPSWRAEDSRIVPEAAEETTPIDVPWPGQM